jgi:hypothetical protein
MKRSKRVSKLKRVSNSRSLVAKRVLSPSAKIKRRKPKSVKKSTSTRISYSRSLAAKPTSLVVKRIETKAPLPLKKSRRNPLRRSYLSKDLSELQLSLHKKRPQAPWISRLTTTKSSPERKKSIKVGHYYRSPRTECKRHGYNQAKCNNDPRCIMSARGCQMATIGVRHVVKK